MDIAKIWFLKWIINLLIAKDEDEITDMPVVFDFKYWYPRAFIFNMRIHLNYIKKDV